MNLDFLYGVLNLSFWGYVLVAFVMVQLTFMGVTLYLHRDATHRSLNLHPALRHFFRFWLWMSSGMLTKEWVAVHRKHHARCETEDDPHSPVVFGLKKVLLEGAELYQKAARNPELQEKFGRGTPDDWLERNLYSKHRNLGIILMVITDLGKVPAQVRGRARSGLSRRACDRRRMKSIPSSRAVSAAFCARCAKSCDAWRSMRRRYFTSFTCKGQRAMSTMRALALSESSKWGTS